MRLTEHATVLLVENVGSALDHYLDKLGFEVAHYDQIPEHYGCASRDECHVHFARWEGVRPRPNSEVVPPDMFDVYVYVDDLEALHEDLVERGADLLYGPVDQGYWVREIRVRDPHGYMVAFGQSLR